MYFRLLILLSMLLPELAMAADLFTPVSGDKSMQVLAAMFGQLGTFGSSSSDAFVKVIETFNGAVLIIGGVLVAYTIVIGTVGTAHDGEMLGKKFSSVWVPIRTAMGTALILPVIGGGYCVMQLIVGWLIVQGIGIADAVWGAYMSSDSIAKTVQIGLERPQIKDFTWKTMSSLVCLKGYEKIYRKASNETPNVFPALNFGLTTETTPVSTVISFGVPTNDGGFFKDSCGTVTVSRNDPLPASTYADAMLGDISALNGDLSAADAKNLQAVQALIASLTSAADTFTNNPAYSSALESAVTSASNAYSTTMKDAASGIVNKVSDFNQLQKSATQDGWMLAGAWYMRMSYLMDVAQKAVGKTPEASGAKGVTSKTFQDSFINQYAKVLQEIKDKSMSATEFGVGNSEANSESATGGLWDWIKSGFSLDKLIKKVFKADALTAAENNAHPVMEMKRVGSWAGIAAGTMYAAYGSALTAAGTLQGNGVSFAIATLPLAMIVFPMLAVLTFTLSFVLPMMPFMIWIGVFLGWLILCVEAIIAAPMWAVMHLSPNGDDLVGTASQGYRLVLSLILRPVLMVFGLIAALTIITVFGQMINKVFFDVFILSQQDSNIFIWLISLLAAPMIYMGLMWTLITKTMNIIHVIPDQLLQWFGGGGPQIGDYGQTMGGHGSQSYGAMSQMGSIGAKGLDAKRNMVDLNKQSQQVAEQKETNKQLKDEADKKKNFEKEEKFGKTGAKLLGGSGNSGMSMNMGPNPAKKTQQGGSFNSAQNAVNEARQEIQMEGAVQSLGGTESSDYMAFTEAMEKDTDAGMSFQQAFNKNYGQSLDQKYGSGVGEFIVKSSNGNINPHSSGFVKGLEQVSTIQAMYGKLPPNQMQEKTSALINSAIKDVAKSGGNINDAVNSKIDFAYQNSKSVDKTAITPPSAGAADEKG